MKKIAVMLLTILLFSLTGCSKEPPTISDSFTVGLQAEYNQLGLSGVLTHNANGTQITFTEPYTLSGLRFGYADEELTIGFTGHETHADSGYLPEAALPSRLYTTLLYLSQAQYTDSKDGTDAFAIPTPSGEAVLTAKEGIPTLLTLPHGQKIIFRPEE